MEALKGIGENPAGKAGHEEGSPPAQRTWSTAACPPRLGEAPPTESGPASRRWGWLGFDKGPPFCLLSSIPGSLRKSNPGASAFEVRESDSIQKA